MVNKIEQKIVGYKVVDKNETPAVEATKETMHEGIARTESLSGTTYKIKTPQSEHALYITINDMILDGVHHPYEMFINSKNMEHFQWVLAMTRLISAVWRKGGNCDFLIDELKSVFDPQGGYWKKSRFIPSIVADIGLTIEQHLKQSKQDAAKKTMLDLLDYSEEGLKNAELCTSCNTKSLVLMDGCVTCVSCGFSKCQ